MARDSSIDIAKGVGIILVVFGHDTLCPSIIRNVIFSFHMPLFFILSGYFYKDKNFKDVIVGGGKIMEVLCCSSAYTIVNTCYIPT